jgi:LPPG:FO 2-phospho-L-lactate transferase
MVLLMKVTALAGGVGGAKLLLGLQAMAGDDLTAIVNTGDDATIYGVKVCPDVDIVTYWLAGIADRTRGWGIEGDSFDVVDALGKLGYETWFSLGDRDFATCLHRTRLLNEGLTLSQIVDDVRRSLGVRARILPMSDDPVPTKIVTADGTELEFQEYFVRERQQPEVAEVAFEGAAIASAAPGAIDAIDEADVIVICPSNPIVSIAPILALDGIRDALVRHPLVIAVSPIVRGKPVKGPADRLLAAMGANVSASGVAELYAAFCNLFVVDVTDGEEADKVRVFGVESVALDTLMVDAGASERLARALLAL